jgi:hypothetical protein
MLATVIIALSALPHPVICQVNVFGPSRLAPIAMGLASTLTIRLPCVPHPSHYAYMVNHSARREGRSGYFLLVNLRVFYANGMVFRRISASERTLIPIHIPHCSLDPVLHWTCHCNRRESWATQLCSHGHSYRPRSACFCVWYCGASFGTESQWQL